MAKRLTPQSILNGLSQAEKINKALDDFREGKKDKLKKAAQLRAEAAQIELESKAFEGADSLLEDCRNLRDSAIKKIHEAIKAFPESEQGKDKAVHSLSLQAAMEAKVLSKTSSDFNLDYFLQNVPHAKTAYAYFCSGYMLIPLTPLEDLKPYQLYKVSEMLSLGNEYIAEAKLAVELEKKVTIEKLSSPVAKEHKVDPFSLAEFNRVGMTYEDRTNCLAKIERGLIPNVKNAEQYKIHTKTFNIN